jgi:hypothetical protein
VVEIDLDFIIGSGIVSSGLQVGRSGGIMSGKKISRAEPFGVESTAGVFIERADFGVVEERSSIRDAKNNIDTSAQHKANVNRMECGGGSTFFESTSLSFIFIEATSRGLLFFVWHMVVFFLDFLPFILWLCMRSVLLLALGLGNTEFLVDIVEVS